MVLQSTTSSANVGANAVKGMGGVHPIVDQVDFVVDKVTLETVVMDLWEAKNIMQPGGVLAPELQTKKQETKRQLGRQPLHRQSGVKAWLSLADGFVQGGQGEDHNSARRRRGTSGCWSVFESESLVCLIFIL